MKSIIEEFYYGRVIPFEQKAVESDEYDEILEEFLKIEEEISSRSPESEELITKYRKMQIDLQSILLLNEFAKGFRLGARFIIDIYNSID